jgi:hypothetical protein
MKNLTIATKDGIITAIHVLWERGWQVNPESVREMLQLGCHEDSSLEEIEKIIGKIVAPGAAAEWRTHFNHESPWAKEHGFPWEIPAHWKHQQIEK